ncbi:YLP motif-containing protein 1 isoform X2 [Melanotaenia boesemani]|uniref:YLP motif-containing protein 1 isoform X2 n=1 Tax=Melanotaenia boesemani TaxID=1250792 RepID=UPI001C0459C2|nr:YLP motif-containing protein 1 isoform X2 [Melanotaenia boesemani]
MYPSWGNYGAPPSQSYGGPGPRKPPGGSHTSTAAGFGGFEASPGGSLFSSLQEQHLQQMQQLQMLHQKQLQSVLHHGNSGPAYGGGGGGYSGSSWQTEGSGHVEGGDGAQSYYKPEETSGQTTRGPPAPKQGLQQPPPPPPQPHHTEPQPVPPPPESQPPKPPENNGTSNTKDVNNKDSSAVEDNKSLPLQEQQQLWYKQHLQNLQKLRQERSKQFQKEGEASMPPQPSASKALPPLPPSDPPKNTPPPPPPKEEPPVPPPPPVEVRSENVGNSPTFTDTPEVPKDPEEAARLQQLQAAAAQWQQVQQQRAGLQYQALMQQHEKLQQILEQYQQLIQQSSNLQSMSAEMQLRHYEVQQQQFTPLFQDWDRSFALWYEQFQTYPHKDQLQDYEHQWKQWQEQMNATNAHLQERVATLTAMVPFASSQYKSAVIGQFGQYPGQEMQMQQQALNPGIQQTALAAGPNTAGQPPGFGAHSESHTGPPVQGSVPTSVGVRPPGPLTVPPPSFSSVGGQRVSRFDQPPQDFDGPPRFDQPQQRFDGPPRLDQPQQHFDGPPRFEQSQQHFDGPQRFNKPQQRFDVSPRFDQPRQRFDGPHRFDQPRQHFDGPPRFDQPRQRFDGPPRFDQPRQRFDGPPRFDQPRQRFDGPSRFDQPRFGQQPRFESSRPPGPSPCTESPGAPHQKQPGPQPKTEAATQQPAKNVSKTSEKTAGEPQSVKEKNEPDKKTKVEDLTDDSLLGTEGFFVQNDPIPQTLPASTDSEEKDGKNSSDVNEKPKPGNNKPPVSTASAVVAKTPAQTSVKQEGPLTDSKPPQIQKPAGIQPQGSGQMQARPEPPKPPLGRGRGQPLLCGRGRGQMGSGEFRGPSTVPAGEEIGEMPFDYRPPEESMGMPEEQEGYHWQNPSYEEFGDDESEMPPEETWMPEEHYFQEDEYYEEPIGPHMGRGRPPMMRGGAPLGRGGQPMGRGGPPMGRGVPPMGRGGPSMGRGGPPIGRGGPPVGRGGPPMGRGGPPMGRGGPPVGRGGPPMGRGGPPMGRGGPPIGRGGLPMGRGEPMDRHWEDVESAEYSEEGDPYWGEWRPPMRGMRPPFPPGRGRPPRGHPGFMPPGRGRPPHPAHGPMDHERLGHELDSDDTNIDPSMHSVYHGHDPYSHPMHPDVGRDRRRIPPPPHEIMEEPLYDEEREQDWPPQHGRGPPLPPHEIIDRGGKRGRPMGRGIARGMWRPGPAREEYEEGYREGYSVDYDHGEDGFRWRSAKDYPPDDYRQDAKYFQSEWDRERSLSERDYLPRMLPPEHIRDGQWQEETERGHSYAYDDPGRGRGELRIREYGDEPPYRQEEAPLSDWNRPSRLPPPSERGYPDYPDHRLRYDEHREEPSLDILPPPPPAACVTDVSENSPEPAAQGASGANVLALSQRQHEIILKAAQELKQIRELQESKTPSTEQQPSETLPELPAGLLGLEIPPDVRNVLKGMTAAAQTAVTEPVSWENKSVDYTPSLSAAPIPQMIPKTVDYGHGHEPGATVERISYGERIVLRPDPLSSDRGYEKELLGLRDPYSRDPYYERRSDPYMERREYSRERELYREKPPEYERERFERERFISRERDDRSPLAPALRSGYRDRDRDVRDSDRSGSRDPDEHYGRPGYDRAPYERSSLDRIGPERYTSPYMDRRGFPEDRGPPAAAPLPPPPPAPRVEKKPEIKNIDDILKPPGRLSRPERIVIIMRGLPGSGKSHVAKLIRDKEVECGGAPPRVLVLDDYFMTEVEKVEKDPDTGKRVKTKVLEYEYEPEMEDTYRSSMLKTFKKTLDDGFFPFIIIDTVNDRVKHFDQFWSAAKTKGFEVYVAEITADTQTCSKRNVHGRTHKDISKMSNHWESSPRHMVRLDVRSLLQDAAIEEVEMEDFNPDDEPVEPKKEEEEEGDLGYVPKSKWEMDTSEAKLDKLDGLVSGGKRKREGEQSSDLEDYLQLPDDYATRMSEPGKKRVRWADLEEQKDADRKRAIGFVVGQTDWERITDESGQLAQRALNRTKYF